MSLPTPLRGIVPPLVTPLASPDSLDREGFSRLINRIVDAGCSGVFVLGSTGEAQALSYRLRREVIREACRIVAGRITVLVGISDTSIVESVALARDAADAGADAVVTAPPYYYQLTQTDLIRHTSMLVRDLPLPLFLYNMPSLTKTVYQPETVAACAEIENVVGFKDSSGDLLYFRRVLRTIEARPDFTVMIGPEELLAQAIQLGAHGGITGGANLWPELYVDLYRAAVEQRRDQVRRLEARVLDISESVYRVGDPATSYLRGLKAALEIEGICSGLPAAPLTRLSESELALIRGHLAVAAA